MSGNRVITTVLDATEADSATATTQPSFATASGSEMTCDNGRPFSQPVSLSAPESSNPFHPVTFSVIKQDSGISVFTRPKPVHARFSIPGFNC
jgi:hypothetical protein